MAILNYKKKYSILKTKYQKIEKENKQLKIECEKLKIECEKLKKEVEKMAYAFNNDKTKREVVIYPSDCTYVTGNSFTNVYEKNYTAQQTGYILVQCKRADSGLIDIQFGANKMWDYIEAGNNKIYPVKKGDQINLEDDANGKITGIITFFGIGD